MKTYHFYCKKWTCLYCWIFLFRSHIHFHIAMYTWLTQKSQNYDLDIQQSSQFVLMVVSCEGCSASRINSFYSSELHEWHKWKVWCCFLLEALTCAWFHVSPVSYFEICWSQTKCDKTQTDMDGQMDWRTEDGGRCSQTLLTAEGKKKCFIQNTRQQEKSYKPTILIFKKTTKKKQRKEREIVTNFISFFKVQNGNGYNLDVFYPYR